MSSPRDAAEARFARRRLTRFIEKDEFLTMTAVSAAAQQLGFDSLDDYRDKDPVGFVEFVDALCIEMEEDPQYSGNPETGKAWE